MPVLTPHKKLPAVTFTTGWFEYTAVSVFILPGLFMMGREFYLRPATTAIPSALFMLALFFVVYLWLFSFELKVTPLSVSYMSLFDRKRSIRIEDLGAVEIKVGGKPVYCMTFHPKEESEARPIAVNIKPLKKNDLVRLAKFLPKVAPHVRYDERFLMMAEGKMPSAFMKYQ